MLHSRKNLIFIMVFVSIAVVVGVIFFVRGRSVAPAATDASACINQSFSVSSSGNCVTDIQALVNQMQSNKLIEACPFTGGKTLEVNGTFDTATQQQVTVIQAWVNCYNKEESLSEQLNMQGTVDSATWTSLCTYGYTFPKQSSQSDTPALQAAKAAGLDAGCR